MFLPLLNFSFAVDSCNVLGFASIGRWKDLGSAGGAENGEVIGVVVWVLERDGFALAEGALVIEEAIADLFARRWRIQRLTRRAELNWPQLRWIWPMAHPSSNRRVEHRHRVRRNPVRQWRHHALVDLEVVRRALIPHPIHRNGRRRRGQRTYHMLIQINTTGVSIDDVAGDTSLKVKSSN